VELVVRDVFKRHNIHLGRSRSADLEAKAKLAIEYFLKEQTCQTDREMRRAAQKIWKMASSDDPPIAQIRIELSRLPKRIKVLFETRANLCLLRKFTKSRYAGSLDEWFRDAPPEELLWSVCALIPTRLEIVAGQSRGSGRRRDPARIEPKILSITQGNGEDAPKKGRPIKWAERDLILRLAHHWEQIVGEFPNFGRSDHTPFGDLVHSIFQFLRFPISSATSGLRAARKALDTGHEPVRASQ
jgi:hypothetical protein